MPTGKTGRPSKFTPEIATTICERMIAGENLVAICLDPKMPPRSTVYDWIANDPAFRAKCDRAREGLADVQDQKIAQLIEKCTPESAPADRVKLAGLQWRAAKMAPKRYGDRIAHEHGGKDGATAIVQELRWLDPVDPPGEGEG